MSLASAFSNLRAVATRAALWRPRLQRAPKLDELAEENFRSEAGAQNSGSEISPIDVLADAPSIADSAADGDGVLAIRHIAKAYKARRVVEDVSLHVRRGEAVGLLGPNGAGKTTILRMVAGLLQPEAGSISVFGIDTRKDPLKAKSIIAWVSDEPMVYDRLTPYEYLEFVAGLWQIDARQAQVRSTELIEWLGLKPHAHERCGGFSKGMLQKVALAGALVHDPKLIILDEPLTGLDAGSARQVKQVLLDKVKQGVTVIMTTHILEVAERMAERIGVINHGRLIAEGTLTELRARIGREDTLEEIFLDLVAQKEMDVDPAASAVDAAA